MWVSQILTLSVQESTMFNAKLMVHACRLLFTKEICYETVCYSGFTIVKQASVDLSFS